jgi:hypothetical protein
MGMNQREVFFLFLLFFAFFIARMFLTRIMDSGPAAITLTAPLNPVFLRQTAFSNPFLASERAYLATPRSSFALEATLIDFARVPARRRKCLLCFPGTMIIAALAARIVTPFEKRSKRSAVRSLMSSAFSSAQAVSRLAAAALAAFCTAGLTGRLNKCLFSFLFLKPNQHTITTVAEVLFMALRAFCKGFTP